MMTDHCSPVSARTVLDKLADKIAAKIVQLKHYRDNDCQIDHARTIAEGRILQANQIVHWIAEVAVEFATAQAVWQPIETAPKTGEFLVYMPDEHHQYQVMYRTGKLSIVGGAFAFDLTKPTLWAPLPSLSSAQRAEGQ